MGGGAPVRQHPGMTGRFFDLATRPWGFAVGIQSSSREAAVDLLSVKFLLKELHFFFGVVGATEVVDDEEEVSISEQFTAPTPHVYFPSGHERQTSMSSL